MEEELVGQMTNLEKLLKSNNGGDGIFVGKDVGLFFFFYQRMWTVIKSFVQNILRMLNNNLSFR